MAPDEARTEDVRAWLQRAALYARVSTHDRYEEVRA
jgi:predicted site-specific integrase-resolvase